MRRADKPGLLVKTNAAAEAPSLFTTAVNRMGYGETSGQKSEWNQLGGNEPERFLGYVQQQLNPSTIDDSVYEGQRSGAGFTTLDKGLSELWVDHHRSGVGWSERSRPIREVELDTFLRAIYSKRQLQEVMVEFWMNHFSMYGWDYWSVHVWSDVVNIVRTDCFRNFHTLLRKITKHPSMLYYLDNYASTLAGPNENHARELVELHTLGAENYYGVGDPSAVPVEPHPDGTNWPIAYVDNDVYEATRALTGWSVANGSSDRPNNGQFYYDDADHDRFQKIILGLTMPANRKQEDGDDLLRRLADHPGTARHIARKLCRRFISDDPPQNVVDAAAQRFFSRRNSSNQIRDTLQVILESPEFEATWAQKVKRPFDVAVSALRATKSNFNFTWNADDVDDFLWNYDRCGQALFTWPAPDGFPDVRNKWQSTTPRVMTWRLMLWMADERTSSGNYRWNVVSKTTGAGALTAEEVVDYWANRIFRRNLDPLDHDELVDFMANGFSPTSPLPIGNDSDTDARVRSLVALMCNMPTFLER
ncbi:MAG: DUF1800 domain-containing protein [Acidobacteriota bacterium]